MVFLSFLLLAGVAYLIWRISDQLPDVIFRISEIQRDVADIRRKLNGAEPEPVAPSSSADAKPTADASSEPEPASG